MSAFVERAVGRYSHLLSNDTNTETPHERVKKLIKEGESKKVEFKSSLRTNMFTNQVDKNVEHASLKTIAAYLNSDGGTLLIGVGDKGEIAGIEKDNFVSHDKLSLHFTNLLKEHLGPEFLPFVDHKILEMDGKNIVAVECKKSPKEAFLKIGKDEHFYVRNGPASIPMAGSSLIDYITHRFR